MKNDYSYLTFEQIYIFLTAAKFENFSKAASSLNISQPAVSRNITALEDALGIVLFIRHQRRVKLTKAGNYLVSEFEKLLQNTSFIVDRAYQIQSNQFNTLTICSSNVLRNNQYLQPVVQKFQKENPQVEVALEIMDPFEQMEQLIDGSYDLGIVPSAYSEYLRENGLLVSSIRKDSPEIMLSAKHPFYANAEEHISDLLASPIVIMEDKNKLYPPVIQKILKKLNLPHGDLTYVSNLDTAGAMIDMGTHIYIGSHTIHFNTVEKIKCVPLKSVPTSLGLSIAFQDDSENIFVRKFVSLIEEAGWPE